MGRHHLSRGIKKISCLRSSSCPSSPSFSSRSLVPTRLCFLPENKFNSGQATVEYLLAIGVVAVAMAAVLSSGVLFEALADLFSQLSGKIALPSP